MPGATLHASCVARDGLGVLLRGPSGCGKSDLALRLLRLDFTLVADDQVTLAGGIASAPPALAGLLEVRGVGIVRLPHVDQTRLVLVVDLGKPCERLPTSRLDPDLGIPVVAIDAFTVSAAEKVALAFACATETVPMTAGFLTA